jgi:hypothetical protein
MLKLIVEAIVVGIVLCMIGVPILLLSDNNLYSYIIKLFIIGIIVHFLFEFTGGNKWYCDYGYSCKK